MRNQVEFVCALAVLVACDSTPSVSTPAQRDLGTFVVTVDPANQVLTVRQGVSSVADEHLQTITEGSGDGTVTVSNVGTPASDTSCSLAAYSFTGQVQITSNFTSMVLQNVYAVIDSISETGVAACNSDADAQGLTSANGGLWSYGNFYANEGIPDKKTRTWSFALPSAAPFTFIGHVVATEVPSSECHPSCAPYFSCGNDDGCGGSCSCLYSYVCLKSGFCCLPMCGGTICETGDGCGGICRLGSGCTCPGSGLCL